MKLQDIFENKQEKEMEDDITSKIKGKLSLDKFTVEVEDDEDQWLINIGMWKSHDEADEDAEKISKILGVKAEPDYDHASDTGNTAFVGWTVKKGKV